METTAIVAIVFGLLRSLEAAVVLFMISVLYHFGLAPLRRIYGFAPVRRFFARWARGHMLDSPESQTGHDAGI